MTINDRRWTNEEPWTSAKHTAHTVVIGAGIGGLSAAIRLAAAGQRVTIVEKNASIGGKMSQVYQDGFHWDTGPSVITMRHVFEDLFAAAGCRLTEYLDLQPLEPLTRYFYGDGACIDATSNLSRMIEQLASLGEREAEGYLSFLAYAARLHRITGPVFIYDRPPTWRSFLRVSPLDMVRVDPWLTMQQAINRRVRSAHLRQLLGRFATYVGASPFQAPATLSVIAHVELNGGVWYPRGGIYQIAIALFRLCEKLGVTIYRQCPAQKIIVRQGRAVGVETAQGEIAADNVIANVDVATVYHRLLPPDGKTERIKQRLARTETSCSGFVLLLGVEGVHPRLAHHNIFFNQDYRQEFNDIFQRQIPPQEPTIYLAISAKSDAEHAPVGYENWFILVNAPALSPDSNPSFDWKNEAGRYRTLVLDSLARHGYDVRQRIRSEVMLTPQQIAEMSSSWRGALYGISSNRALNAFRRPHNRCSHIQGLYFVGGTTHPGGGVPMVMLSGKVVAEMALEDNGR